VAITNEFIRQGGKQDVFFVTNSSQIKSATANIGTFSPNTGNILYQAEAWHGSPHSFDRFTTEKMGTGEGAQAFGWGLYFTDLEGIARGYAYKLNSNFGIKNQPNTKFTFNGYLYEKIDNDDISKIKYTKNGNVISAKEYFDDYEKLPPLNPSNLYKVTLHKGKTPAEYDWLVWDKPLTDGQKTKIKNYILEKANKSNYNAANFKAAGIDYDYSADGKKITKVYIPNNISGEALYNLFVRANFNDQSVPDTKKQASLDLLELGIDGVKYPAESIARGANSDTAIGFNYVVFDENAVTIEERIQFQNKGLGAQGAIVMQAANRVVYAMTNPNVTTPLHEISHGYFDTLISAAENGNAQAAADVKVFAEQAGVSEADLRTDEAAYTKAQETFARGFEKYLREGKAPTPELQSLFDKFKNWLLEIYKSLAESPIDVPLNDAMRAVYGRMLTPEQVKQDFPYTFYHLPYCYWHNITQ